MATNLRDILIAVKSRLVSQNLFTSTCIFIGKQPDEPKNNPSTAYAMLMTGDARPEDQEVLRVKGSFIVTLFNLTQLDQGNRADVQLLDASLGILSKVDATVSALQMYDPGTLREPMRFVRMGTPKPVWDGWMKVDVEFEIKWVWGT